MKPRGSSAPRRFRRRFFMLSSILVAVLVAGGAWAWRHASSKPAVAREPAPVPVTIATAARQDVPVFLDALGTVQASNTIAVRSQVDGPLQSVNFTEGQEVSR